MKFVKVTFNAKKYSQLSSADTTNERPYTLQFQITGEGRGSNR